MSGDHVPMVAMFPNMSSTDTVHNVSIVHCAVSSFKLMSRGNYL